MPNFMLRRVEGVISEQVVYLQRQKWYEDECQVRQLSTYLLIIDLHELPRHGVLPSKLLEGFCLPEDHGDRPRNHTGSF